MNKVAATAASVLLIVLSFAAQAQKQEYTAERYLDYLFNQSALFDTTHVAAAVTKPDTADLWKHWDTIENFRFGKNRGSLPMIADLEALHPYFRDKVEELIRICQKDGITLAIVETYRTPSKQAEYYAMGKKYTSTPGGKSRHQYGLAVDVVPIVDSVAVWNNHRLWKKIGIVGERLGLRWGGRWKVLYDPGHFEWIGGLSRHDLAKGVLPRIPSSHASKYPEIEKDIARLKRFWDAWEIEQSVVADGKSSKGEGVVGISQ
jgi:hypothetical protein